MEGVAACVDHAPNRSARRGDQPDARPTHGETDNPPTRPGWIYGKTPKVSRSPSDTSRVNTVNGTAELVARIRELAGSRPSPSIADVVGNPDSISPDGPAASEFTAKYEMQALVNTLRSNADMQLALIQMVGPRRRPRG